jgi:hypothetical protein
MFTTPEVEIYLLLQSLLMAFMALSFVAAVRIALYFDPGQDTPLQYRLLKLSYLVSTILFFVLILKIGLFFYLIYTLDKLAEIIPGAMCAAGVVTANRYGVWLLLFELAGIYLFGFWALFHLRESRKKGWEDTRKKFIFFLPLFGLALAQYILAWLYFGALDLGKIVSCCGVLFNPVSSSSIFGSLLQIPPKAVAAAFYALFFAALFLRGWAFRLVHALMVPVAILAIILFFSPYIYELPTHRCPFCLLQGGYHYIGYLIYISLFLGTFWGMAGERKKALLFDAIAVAILSYYVISYYLKNGVWLL